ncbi:coiled-coil domain-containing protein 137 [Discoglossus pictus]
MGKHQKIKACSQTSAPDQKRSNEKKKTNSKPQVLDFQEIPFKLREIMKSRMEMKNPKKKRKRKPEKQGSQNAELQTDIPVPKFKRKKRESVGAYLQRMEQETQHVMFLSKNQPDRVPEKDPETTEDGKEQKEKLPKEKSQKKKEFDRRRQEKILKKKEEKRVNLMEKEMFEDRVKFGEVAMEPPSFTVKPRKSSAVTKPGEKQLLLKKLLDKDNAPAKPPPTSLARQRLLEEERERVVHAYRELKKRQQEQRVKVNVPKKAKKTSP